MSAIQTFLDQIKTAVYGEEVRDAIHDGIKTCYDDVTSGKTAADSAASAANAAANNANEKATLAEEKATAANAATSAANAATSAANAAAENATSKAEAAKAATDAANEAATNAADARDTANKAAASANAATEDATKAATTATNAANAANTAATNANAAVVSASTAVNNANTASASANNAANAANTAAQTANEKATAANAAAETAKTAADNLTTAEKNANEAATAANTAANAATSAASAADTAATAANAAAETAKTAAATASEKADNAEMATLDCGTAVYNANVATASATTATDRANTAAASIEGLTITSENVGPNELAEATLNEVNGHKNIHLRLRQGATGAPYIIKGNAYASLSALESAITSPAIGDQYNVGSAAPYTVYRWTGTQWENQGAIGISVVAITTAEIDAVVNETEDTISQKVGKYLDLNGLIHLFTDKLKAMFAAKVDKIAGKGLSTNDFTDEYKTKIGTLDSNVTALKNTKVDKITGKGLSTNDFTSAYKTQVDQNTTDISNLKTNKVDKVSGKGLSTNDFTDAYVEMLEHARPDTWTPTAEDVGAVPEDGTAADAAKLGGKAPEYYIQPRNLLDNSDFTNPVNQRGQTSYGTNVYTIDRWRLWSTNGNATLTCKAGYVEFSSGQDAQSILGQRFPKGYLNENKTYTLAYMDTSGTVYIRRGAEAVDHTTSDVHDAAWIRIRNSAAVNIVWAALYEGVYTADTLPPYVPKGYAAELAACQRYYQVLGGSVFYTATALDWTHFFTPMRVTPTATITSKNGTAGKMSIYTNAWTDVDASASPEDTLARSIRIRCDQGAGTYGWNKVELNAEL